MTDHHPQPQQHCSETLLPPCATSAAVGLNRVAIHSQKHQFPIYSKQAPPNQSYGDSLSPEDLVLGTSFLSLLILTLLVMWVKRAFWTPGLEDVPIY